MLAGTARGPRKWLLTKKGERKSGQGEGLGKKKEGGEKALHIQRGGVQVNPPYTRNISFMGEKGEEGGLSS